MHTHPFLQKDHFLLGTFASNCSGGMTVSKLPGRWPADWESNLKLGKLLDDAGIDFMLPIARWIGYGGETNFHGYVLETITWATALLAHTRRITVFGTVHTMANHPVIVAKQLATIAQISGDRVGLNVVAGWNKPEYEALGLTLPDDHETRYGYAQEWFDIIQKLWTHQGPFVPRPISNTTRICRLLQATSPTMPASAFAAFSPATANIATRLLFST